MTLSYDAEGRLRQTAIGGATTNLLYQALRHVVSQTWDGLNLVDSFIKADVSFK